MSFEILMYIITSECISFILNIILLKYESGFFDKI